MERFGLSEIQAQAILDMRLKTLSGLQREKIEEEYDLAVFDDAYDEYKKSGEESRPISDFWKELDIWVML